MDIEWCLTKLAGIRTMIELAGSTPHEVMRRQHLDSAARALEAVMRNLSSGLEEKR